MGKTSTRDRMKNEINAGSMADIAFLLLIFFLVTTQIVEDKGIFVNLPIWSDEPPPELQFAEQNVYAILVNANNDLLVRGQPMLLRDLREGVKEFITNNGRRPDLSDSPQDAIVSLKNDRGTKYQTYLEVYNEVKGAYIELWDALAQDRYGTPYSDDMPIAQRRALREDIPILLSEAEPTAFGAEE